ncbi:MAG: hypothetical protein CMM25_02265 [Rhodospirillaceae bacterium]|nr:hypothetical protein [Rhodospirillaceae bacterium]|tara:strand:- start:282 stop:545 length:264 start_codon:yes stop_codon:yes gene_type:complete
MCGDNADFLFCLNYSFITIRFCIGQSYIISHFIDVVILKCTAILSISMASAKLGLEALNAIEWQVSVIKIVLELRIFRKLCQILIMI